MTGGASSDSAEEIRQLKIYVPIACSLLAFETLVYWSQRHRENVRRRVPLATVFAALAAVAYTCIEYMFETKGGSLWAVLQGVGVEFTFATVVLPFLFRGWLVLYQSKWENMKRRFGAGQAGKIQWANGNRGGGALPEDLEKELLWFKRNAWATQTRGYFLLLGPWLMVVACGVVVTMWFDETLEGNIVHFSSEALVLSGILASVYFVALLVIAYHVRHVRDEYDIKKEFYLALLFFAMYISTNVARRVDFAGVDLLELSTVLAGVTIMTVYPLAESCLGRGQRSRATRPVEQGSAHTNTSSSVAGEGLLRASYFSGSPQGREMKSILVDDDLRAAFKQFLSYLWCSENLCFVEEVLAFQTAVDCVASNEEIADRVRNICDTYLVEGSSLEVNVSHNMRQNVLDAVAQQKDGLGTLRDTPGLFNECAVEVSDMMAHNGLEKFKKADLYDAKKATYAAARLSAA